jgi:hypothetical protein
VHDDYDPSQDVVVGDDGGDENGGYAQDGGQDQRGELQYLAELENDVGGYAPPEDDGGEEYDQGGDGGDDDY